MKVFSKHKCLGKTSKPTDSESLMWRLEINIHKKFQKDISAYLVLRITDLKQEWISQFWGGMVHSLFWKRVLWFCQSWELRGSNFNLGYTLDSSGEAFKNHNCRVYPDQIKKNLWGEIQTCRAMSWGWSRQLEGAGVGGGSQHQEISWSDSEAGEREETWLFP